MSGMTNYLAEQLLNQIFRTTVWTPPDTVYLALFTTAPSDTGGGTEVNGGSYSPQPVTFSPAVNATGVIANNNTVTFMNMPACTVTGAAFVDAVTGGNMLYFIDGLNRTVSVGENLFLNIGDATCSLG